MNKELRFNAIVYLTLFLIVSFAYGGDQASFRFYGFSEDGQYVVWESGGVQDGSGFKWVELEVLNTQTSLREEVFSHVWGEYIDELSDMEDLSVLGESKEDLFLFWKINLNQNYEPLVFYPLTDLGAQRDTVAFCLENYVPDYHSGEITLTLFNKPARIEQNYPDWFPPPVTPVLYIEFNGEESLFFQESTVPEEWSLSMSYGIYAVYRNPILPENLIVVLASTEPGFEGSNGRFRVVSGRL